MIFTSYGWRFCKKHPGHVVIRLLRFAAVNDSNVVAEVLNLPINTVKTNLRRARLALIAKLARHNAIKHGEVPS